MLPVLAEKKTVDLWNHPVFFLIGKIDWDPSGVVLFSYDLIGKVPMDLGFGVVGGEESRLLGGDCQGFDRPEEVGCRLGWLARLLVVPH